MRIRKKSTSIGITASVVNDDSTSTVNAYSCNYINNDLKALILDLAHPVGSYYWSSDSTDPKDLFGGTWTQVKDKFIIAVGDSHTVGTSYGSNTKDLSHTHSDAHTHGVPGVSHKHTTSGHTLTVDEMPSHSHTASRANVPYGIPYNTTSGQGTGLAGGSQINYGETYSPVVSIGDTGGGGSHSHGDTGSTTPSSTTTNSQSSSTTGSALSTTFDITPACEAAYCWKRTA